MTTDASETIALVLAARTRDLGDGMTVRRVLPAAARRMVGPFIFFDHMGPVQLPVGRGVDVRPHPHINLATVTYLFEGELLHRDSLGSEQVIRPGAVNWMTAGRGIVHSERSSVADRARGPRLHGIQLWVALPRAFEEVEPSFAHHPVETIPTLERSGARISVVAGAAFGLTAPVQGLSPLFYVAATLPAGAMLTVPDEQPERAVYVVDGRIDCAGQVYEAGHMLVLRAGANVCVEALAPARLMLLGGAPVDGERHVHWNFVSSSRERIERAKQDWRERRFGLVPGDEQEFIPLPE